MKKKNVKQILLENIYPVLYRHDFLPGESVCGLLPALGTLLRHSITLSDQTVLTKPQTYGAILGKPTFPGIRVQK